MNLLIQELAEQAQKVVGYTDGGYTEIKALDQEKFAELIVRECARVYWNIDDSEIHGEYVKALKKHFGVEE